VRGLQASDASIAVTGILEILKANTAAGDLANPAPVTTTSTPTPSETAIGMSRRLTVPTENSLELETYFYASRACKK